MTDESEAAVEEFLAAVETVYDEYDQGYLDADAALRRLRVEVDDLAESVED